MFCHFRVLIPPSFLGRKRYKLRSKPTHQFEKVLDPPLCNKCPVLKMLLMGLAFKIETHTIVQKLICQNRG